MGDTCTSAQLIDQLSSKHSPVCLLFPRWESSLYKELVIHNSCIFMPVFSPIRWPAWIYDIFMPNAVYSLGELRKSFLEKVEFCFRIKGWGDSHALTSAQAFLGLRKINTVGRVWCAHWLAVKWGYAETPQVGNKVLTGGGPHGGEGRHDGCMGGSLLVFSEAWALRKLPALGQSAL